MTLTPDQNASFWDGRHKENNQYWLTGSDPMYVYEFHHLRRRLVDKASSRTLRVMEIGVGMGNSIATLAQEMGHEVVAVDISPTALDRVRPFAITCLTPDMGQLPVDSIDIALCHLVMQHCDEDMVRHLIRCTLRALRHNLDSVFSFQFASLPDSSKLDAFHQESVERGTHHFYTPERMERIVKECGGEVVWMSDPTVWKESFDITWYVMHIGHLDLVGDVNGTPI